MSAHDKAKEVWEVAKQAMAVLADSIHKKSMVEPPPYGVLPSENEEKAIDAWITKFSRTRREVVPDCFAPWILARFAIAEECAAERIRAGGIPCPASIEDAIMVLAVLDWHTHGRRIWGTKD